ncbi:low molecular weight protein-tyrosine-phosphatase [Paenibacillus hodogayensis]|uniref:protein-tyrosine-phosphatase n=1 Tax=Paenibacillus hodogayensis TaxID=279208 RepID=A0ABV5W274_9BACL
MIRVLFVCLGNICRSPMAEAVLRKQVKERGWEGQISVDSAGTGDWHIGHPPHEGTRKLLDSKRIAWDGMKARQVTGDDFRRFDYIVAMDESNMHNLRVLAEESGLPGKTEEEGAGWESKLFRLLDLLPDESQDNVPDPYYTGNFEEVYRLVETGCAALLDKIGSERLARTDAD